MKKFIIRAILFFLLPVIVGLGWTIFVVVMDWRSYSRALTMPEDAMMVVCGDSQTKDGLNPALVPGLYNFSTAATTCDQDLLRLLDLLVRNRGHVKYVLLDVSPLKVGYSTEKPVSELNSGRVHALLYFYHLLDMRRPMGSVGALWRDVVCTRKYNEFRKSILRGKPWRSSMAGTFDPDKTQGFLNPKFRERALADVADKASHVNDHPPADTGLPIFAILAESAGLVRAAGATPIITTMPLSRPLRAAIDPAKLAAFREAVGGVAVRLGVEHLDYLDLDLPDEYWHDGNHLNVAGADVFSKRFADDLIIALKRSAAPETGIWTKSDFVGECNRPTEPTDLSGLSHGDGDVYWSVRDAAGEVCELRVPMDHATGRVMGCEILRRVKVEGRRDLEAIAFDPLRKSVWVSDEKGPAIVEFLLDEGREGARVDLPADLLGVLKQRGLEALEISSDGRTMWTCNENELPADDKASLGPSEFVRLTRFSRRSSDAVWHVSGQWAYRPETPGGLRVRGVSRNGVASLCVLPNGDVLMLERERTGPNLARTHLRIYRVEFAGATDIRGWTSLGDADFVPVRKRLLFERDTGTARYEGICCGPVLEDGSQTLLLVSDGDHATAKGMLMSVRLSRRP